jgi:hypothetical protein
MSPASKKEKIEKFLAEKKSGKQSKNLYKNYKFTKTHKLVKLHKTNQPANSNTVPQNSNSQRKPKTPIRNADKANLNLLPHTLKITISNEGKARIACCG